MSKDHVRNFPGPKVTLNRQVIIKELTGAFIPFALDIIKQMSASAKESAVNINAAIREGRIDDVVRLVRDHGVSTNFQESEVKIRICLDDFISTLHSALFPFLINCREAQHRS